MEVFMDADQRDQQIDMYQNFLLAPTFNMKQAQAFFKERGIEVDEKEYFHKGAPIKEKVPELAGIIVDAVNREEAEAEFQEEKVGEATNEEMIPVESLDDEPVVEDAEVIESTDDDSPKVDGELDLSELETVDVDPLDQSEPDETKFEYQNPHMLEHTDLIDGTSGYLRLEDIELSTNVRVLQSDEKFMQLKSSIRRNGVIQPVVVNKECVLVAGYRRYYASQDVGFEVIPVVVVAGSRFSIQVAENIDREDLCALDFCLAVRDAEKQYGWSRDEISAVFGIHKTVVSRICSHIDSIPEAGYEYLRGEKADTALMALIELAEIDDEEIILALITRDEPLKLKDIRAVVKSLKANDTVEGDDKGDGVGDSSGQTQADEVKLLISIEARLEKSSKEYLQELQEFLELVEVSDQLPDFNLDVLRKIDKVVTDILNKY
jgi:ParB/RepB/Spo0J family partition protein